MCAQIFLFVLHCFRRDMSSHQYTSLFSSFFWRQKKNTGNMQSVYAHFFSLNSSCLICKPCERRKIEGKYNEKVYKMPPHFLVFFTAEHRKNGDLSFVHLLLAPAKEMLRLCQEILWNKPGIVTAHMMLRHKKKKNLHNNLRHAYCDEEKKNGFKPCHHHPPRHRFFLRLSFFMGHRTKEEKIQGTQLCKVIEVR